MLLGCLAEQRGVLQEAYRVEGVVQDESVLNSNREGAAPGINVNGNSDRIRQTLRNEGGYLHFENPPLPIAGAGFHSLLLWRGRGRN